MPDPLTAKNLISQGVRHGFFTRRGGVSRGPYASLNVGLGSQDRKDFILKNRELAARHFGLQAGDLCTAYQIHSADVIRVSEPWLAESAPMGDAMITSEKRIILGILTADCVPVLFSDHDAGIIAVTHAGWKGALMGVIKNTIGGMEEMGAKRRNICAAIGPAIHQPSYEVDDAFFQRFLDQDPAFDKFFESGTPGHHQFDLVGFVADRLRAENIESPELISRDTYVDGDNFFSYRRTTHENAPDYGRQLSAICML